MHILPFQAIYPNLSLIASPDSFFGNVKHKYPEYVKNGFFKKSSSESIYVYQIKSPKESYRGIISGTHISEFMNDKILTHENTLAQKEQQMMNVVLRNQAMVKPILLAYKKSKNINNFIHEVIENQESFFEVEFKESQEVHAIWEVSKGENIQKLKQLFATEIKQSYIADGHHRRQTTINLFENKDSKAKYQESLSGVLTIYFSFDQLKIFDYNRIIVPFTKGKAMIFMARLSQHFNIRPLKSAKKPQKKHEITMYLHKQWYLLEWKKSVLKAHKGQMVIFDAYLLNKYVLEEIVGIEEIRTDRRIKYVDGNSTFNRFQEIVRDNKKAVGFCLYPISAKELRVIAENNLTLPPKSTWFEPRIKNGMIVKEI